MFGGTGAVGAEVLKGLARAGIPTAFTWFRAAERARALAAELSQRALQVDLGSAPATRAALHELHASGLRPTLFIHCAAVIRSAALGELTDEDWRQAHAVNCQSAFIAVQALAPTMVERKEGDVVLVSALDRTQSARLPVHFAASQGALPALAMALAKELGPNGVRANVVSLGILEEGLSRAVDPRLRDDYRNFSALRRLGSAAEAAKAILWLALENTYINGRVVAVNGGL
ncbi:MAG TPA: SDR family oxidoreductase [Burkholderiales bacterium]|nr:SDR family oxidoreductase [Burkholderiales bacterium]